LFRLRRKGEGLGINEERLKIREEGILLSN
jgi:hypothetical protein